MNILASYAWLKQYVELKGTAQDFAARVSLSGPGVERLYPQGEELDKIVLGHVIEITPHPDADKLRLAKTDIGNMHVTIVCGGSNLKEDQWVAVALVGAKVRWHGEGDLVELKPAEIRGIKSDGMICAANEIGLFDAFPHNEREILDLGEALPELKLKAGTPLATVLGLASDTLMDIEVTTNRPDAMCLVGLAREAAAILKQPFIWEAAKLPGSQNASGNLKVSVSEKKLCPRYMAAQIDNVKVGPSPWWLKRRLLSAGVRPINNVVDITNFVMLELAQPMHAFDAEKLEGNRLDIRQAKKGESLAALDGKTYELGPEMLVIADAEKPAAVAGIMGGEKSSVTSATVSVIFEAATFDPISVRRTARKLNLYSDSQLRFEKGLSTEAPPDALARAIELCLELCGGTLKQKVYDSQTAKYKAKSYSVTFDEIKNLIGVEIPKKEAADTLKRLGFKLKVSSSKIQATVPWWRDHDLESGRDLIEEIARVYGYIKLPAVFPAGKATEAVPTELKLEQKLRKAMQAASYTETFTYSFVSRELLEMSGWNADELLRVQNPLSTDFEFMRASLLPSLLQVAMQNQERFREQKIFEIAHTFVKTKAGWKDLPDEELMLSALIMDKHSAWKEAKGLAEYIFAQLGITDTQWRRLETDSFWHPGRSAMAYSHGHYLGTIGELHPRIAARFGFSEHVALIDLPLEKIFSQSQSARSYTPLPAYPEAKRDLALIVPKNVTVDGVTELALKASKYLRKIEWFDTYRGPELGAEKKSIAFHLQFAADDRTLQSSEVDHELQEIVDSLQREYAAEVRA